MSSAQSNPPSATMAIVARGLVIALVVAAAGCSLFTDLGGFDDRAANPGGPDGGTLAEGGGPGGPDGEGGAPSCVADLQTDVTNCGRCGRNCAGGQCIAGECTPLIIAPNMPGASPLAVTGDSVYVGEDRDNGALWRMPKAGGKLDHLGNMDSVNAIVADATGAFFTSGKSTVLRFAPLAGDVQTVVDLQMRTHWARRIKSDLWFAGYRQPSGIILKVNGTDMTTVDTGGEGYGHFVADDKNVYVTTDFGPIEVYSIDPPAHVRSIATGSFFVSMLAQDSEALYAVANEDGAVLSFEKVSGTRTVIGQVPAEGETFFSVALDGDTLYVASTDGRIFRVAKSGGDAVPMASVDLPIRALEQDETFLYFTASSEDEGGLAGRLAK